MNMYYEFSTVFGKFEEISSNWQAFGKLIWRSVYGAQDLNISNSISGIWPVKNLAGQTGLGRQFDQLLARSIMKISQPMIFWHVIDLLMHKDTMSSSYTLATSYLPCQRCCCHLQALVPKWEIFCQKFFSRCCLMCFKFHFHVSNGLITSCHVNHWYVCHVSFEYHMFLSTLH